MATKTGITHAELKTKQRAIREGFPQTMSLRVHRAISWIGRAEACGADDDARFIFLWIAFNAAYADEGEFQTIQPGERAAFSDFFGRLIALDGQRRIYGAIWQRFSGPVRLLMDNRYVFNPFWQHHNGIAGFEDWEERFKASSRTFAQGGPERRYQARTQLRLRSALRVAQPTRPWRLDLEQRHQPHSGPRRRGHPRLPHARLR
jgi:hypothetical protein